MSKTVATLLKEANDEFAGLKAALSGLSEDVVNAKVARGNLAVEADQTVRRITEFIAQNTPQEDLIYPVTQAIDPNYTALYLQNKTINHPDVIEVQAKLNNAEEAEITANSKLDVALEDIRITSEVSANLRALISD